MKKENIKHIGVLIIRLILVSATIVAYTFGTDSESNHALLVCTILSFILL